MSSRTMSIAYLSPLAPLRTGLANYSEELLPHLCRRLRVDVYTDDRIAATQEIGRAWPVYGYRDLPAQRGRYDQIVYQLGNGPEYVPIYDLFQRYGGVVALHDLDLSGVIGAKTLRQGDGWGYLRELGRNEGLGTWLATAGQALLRGRWSARRGLEMNRVVAQRAAGVIVHSAAAREHLLARFPAAAVRHITLGIRRPPRPDPAEARRLLDLPPDAFVAVSMGRLGPEKRLHVVLQAWARLLECEPDAHLVLLGEPALGYPLRDMAHTLGITGRVHMPGYVDLSTVYRYLAASDVGINLRVSTRGEMSASLLRIMSMAQPALVSNCQPYTQIPGDCVLRVDPGAGEGEQLLSGLWAFAQHRSLRENYGRRAARWVQCEHSLAASARQYIQFLEETAAVQAAEEMLRRERPFLLAKGRVAEAVGGR
jgi:glycosyltransferase involved in cell wall biosynthesis